MKKLLVVDSDRIIRLLCARELTQEGCKVTTAAAGREALVHFREERPDLVILDIQTQGMDDLEAIGHIISHDPTVPMVFNSAYPNYKDSSFSRPADAYVSKSPDLTELKQRIKGLLISRSAWAPVTEWQLHPVESKSDVVTDNRKSETK